MFGQFSFKDFSDDKPTFGPIFLNIYLFIIAIIFLNLLVAILAFKFDKEFSDDVVYGLEDDEAK